MAGNYNKNLDLRIQKTYILLSQTLLELLKEKSFIEIRVSDICSKAMINRSTFYNHFEDKYDFLEYFLKDLMNKFEIEAMKIPSSSTSLKSHYTNLYRIILKHLEENKNLYFVGFDHHNNDTALNIFQKILTELIQADFDKHIKSGMKFSVPSKIMAILFSSSMISIGSWWLENNTPIPIDELVSYLDKIISKLTLYES